MRKIFFIMFFMSLVGCVKTEDQLALEDLDTEIVNIIDSCTTKNECYEKLSGIEVSDEFSEAYVKNIAAVYKD